jgi:hypothetical protein
MSGDQNGDGLGGDRPDLIGRVQINPGNPHRLFNLSAPVFGSITTAGRPREIQFGLKLEF